MATNEKAIHTQESLIKWIYKINKKYLMQNSETNLNINNVNNNKNCLNLWILQIELIHLHCLSMISLLTEDI